MQTDKISVIVPVYNSEKFLIRCIESIIRQSYANLEIILVNDGSADGSGNICDEFSSKDNRVKVLHQQNKGASAARNAGVGVSTGDWLGFIDSDDHIESGMYESLLNTVQASSAQIGACGYITTYLDGCVEETVIKDIPPVMRGLTALEFILKPSCLEGFLCNKLFHRSLFGHTAKPLCEDLFFCEDLLFVVEAFTKAAYVAYVPEAFYHYCMHPQSAMAIFDAKRETELDAKRRVLDLVRRLPKRYAKYVKAGYVDSAAYMLYAVAKQGEYRPGVTKFLKKEAKRYFALYLLSLEISLKKKARSGAIIAAPRLSWRIWKRVRGKVDIRWH